MSSNLQYTLFKEGFYRQEEKERQQKKLISSLQDLKEIQNNLNDLLLKQDHELSRVDENMSHLKIDWKIVLKTLLKQIICISHINLL